MAACVERQHCAREA